MEEIHAGPRRRQRGNNGSRRRELEEKIQKRKRQRRRRWCMMSLAVLVFVLAGSYVLVRRETMGFRTSVYGTGVSCLTPKKAAEKLVEVFAETKVSFVENGETIYEQTLETMGYAIDQALLEQELLSVLEEKRKDSSFIEKKADYQLPYELIVDEQALKNALLASHFETGEERVPSVSAYMEYNTEKGAFHIVDDVLGTEINEEKMISYVKGQLQEQLEEDLLTSEILIEVSGGYRDAEVRSDDALLNSRLEELNKSLEHYRSASVVYTFGSEEEVLDTDTILSWLTVTDTDVTIDGEKVRAYIKELGNKYNTRYVPRYLQTSGSGETIEITNNEAGYWIDEAGEFEQLMEDLESGTEVRREPVYSYAGLGREGNDDLLGSYIEVDLTRQHLWLYQGGVLITETDIVSGQPTEERETYRGAYTLAYKASPFTLSSDIYGYEVEVAYWMPFVYGQGLHDASWQSGFGGELYKTAAGSHGCINLPVYQAALIYDTVEEGYPILIY
jgi:hypothetical protein